MGEGKGAVAEGIFKAINKKLERDWMSREENINREERRQKRFAEAVSKFRSVIGRKRIA